MGQENINIAITLSDQFTKGMVQVNKTLDNAGKHIEKLGKDLNQMGSRMTVLGGIITGGFALAMRNVSQYSTEASRVFDDISNSLLDLQEVVVDAVLPIFQGVSNIIRSVTNLFKNMDPEIRNISLQVLLMSGIFLTLGGIALKVIGSIGVILGNLLQALNPVTLSLIVLSSYVLLFVYQWDNIRSFVLPVVHALHVGAITVAIGWEKVAMAMTNVMGVMNSILGKDDLVNHFAKQSAEIQMKIGELEQNLERALIGDDLGSKIDEGVEKVRSFFDRIKEMFAGTTTSLSSEVQYFSSEFEKVFEQAVVKVNNLGQQSAQIIVTHVQSLSKGFGDAVGNMLIKGKNFGESMKQVAEQMAVSFISAIVQMIAQWVAMGIAQQVFMAAQVAVATAAAGALAAIWAPVAAMVSLATLGGNAGPATAAIAATTAFAHAAAIPKLADGGIVTRPTIALIGERGPEAVVPLSRSSYKTVQYVNIEINNPNITSGMDMQDLANEISRRLARESERIR